MLLSTYFRAAGFETRMDYWIAGDRTLIRRIFPEIRTWQPDVICVMFNSHITQEPDEWPRFYQLLQDDTELKHTKIMAFLPPASFVFKQEAIRNQWYDFYTSDVKVFESLDLAKTAKEFVGEKIRGFEGVNFFLKRIDHKGKWRLQGYLLDHKLSREELAPDVEGEFATTPGIRLLELSGLESFTWSIRDILVGVPTYIVYLIKELPEWSQGLTNSDTERLTLLSQQNNLKYQLLVGANSLLLQSGQKNVVRILKQVQQTGDWRIFINEHLWGLAVGWNIKKIYEES